MIQFGLIGYPLSHSFSKGYFTEKFQQLGMENRLRYDNYPLSSITAFPKLLQDEARLKGINVTIPYKQKVIPYLDTLSPDAVAIGAVNTILINQNGLTGYNTDVIGFEVSLNALLNASGGPAGSALVLGTGGAAKGICWVLDKLGVPFHMVSRRAGPGRLTYDELDDKHIEAADLIINTTPVGMWPAIDTCPNIPYHCLGPKHRLYDLVYNPEETLFLRQGRERGSAIVNGLAMLHGQAEAAWDIWAADLKL